MEVEDETVAEDEMAGGLVAEGSPGLADWARSMRRRWGTRWSYRRTRPVTGWWWRRTRTRRPCRKLPLTQDRGHGVRPHMAHINL